MWFLKGTCLLITALLTIATVFMALVGCGADCNDPCGLGVPRGALRVSSDPAGALIVLDGSGTGRTTDVILTDVRQGPHTVQVSLEGYKAFPETVHVDVVAGDTVDVSFAMTLSGRGGIAVFSDPPGASIFLDGIGRQRTTPDTLEQVPEGTHVVRVFLDGYRSSPESLLVTVLEDSITSAPFALNLRQIVLVEHFSNTGCGPCPLVEENLELAVSQLGHGVVVTIGNHLNFPEPFDVFYVANPAQLDQRARAFNAYILPHMRINGVEFKDAADYDALLAAIAAAAESEPHFRIDVSAAAAADSFVVSGTVEKILGTAEGDEALLAVIIETDIYYEASNGQTHFDDIVRRFLPGTNGMPLSLGVEEPYEFRFAEALSSGWNAENLEAVVFVESGSTRKVYQAGSTRTLGKP
ncbi:MAG: PEGA domain-containing protein [Candidatus Eisenbacteria bacterium]